MKIDLSKLFDINIIKKFVKYDWKNIFITLDENKNEDILLPSSYENLFNGAILKCLTFIIYMFVKILRYSLFPIEASFILAEAVGLFVLLNLNKGQKENKFIYVVIFVIAFLDIIGFLAGCIKILIFMEDLILVGVILIIGFLFSILADIHIIVGSLDFCNHINGLTPVKKTKTEKTNNKNFCAHCGNKVKQKDKFCAACGEKIK